MLMTIMVIKRLFCVNLFKLRTTVRFLPQRLGTVKAEHSPFFSEVVNLFKIRRTCLILICMIFFRVNVS